MNKLHDNLYASGLLTRSACLRADQLYNVYAPGSTFKASEFLAHFATYQLTSLDIKDKILKIEDSDGIVRDYCVKPIKTTDTALSGFIFVPQNPQQNEKNNIHITWTGTYNFASVKADVQTTPGEQSYRLEEKTIVQQINQAIHEVSSQSNSKIQLSFYGHSLGGALAQNTFHTAQRAIAFNIAKNDESSNIMLQNSELKYRRNAPYKLDRQESHLHSLNGFDSQQISCFTPREIASLRIHTWNSPGVDHAVATQSNELAAILSEKGVTQKGFFSIVSGDIIQTAGHANVLYDAQPKDAHVKVLKINKGREGFIKKSLMVGASALLAGSALFSGGTTLMATSAAALMVSAFSVLAPTKTSHCAYHFIQETGENRNPNKRLKNLCQTPGQKPDYILYDNQDPVSRPKIRNKLEKTGKSRVLGYLSKAFNFFRPAKKCSDLQRNIQTSTTNPGPSPVQSSPR